MDSMALPFIRRGLMKYLPSGDTKSHVQLDGEDPKPTEQMMIKTIVIIIIFSCMLTGIAKV